MTSGVADSMAELHFHEVTRVLPTCELATRLATGRLASKAPDLPVGACSEQEVPIRYWSDTTRASAEPLTFGHGDPLQAH